MLHPRRICGIIIAFQFAKVVVVVALVLWYCGRVDVIEMADYY